MNSSLISVLIDSLRDAGHRLSWSQPPVPRSYFSLVLAMAASAVCTACPTAEAPLPCGDGVVDESVGESCDDGNRQDGDGCSALCEIEDGYACASGGTCYASCGDGIVTADEQCDDGVNNGPGYGQCAYDCTFGPYCGDGVVDLPEECDDGASNGITGACYFDCTRNRR